MKDVLFLFVRWIVGSIFTFTAFSFAQNGIISALCFLVIGIFAIPAVSNVPEKIIKKTITSSEKFLICIVLLFIAVATSPDTPSDEKAHQVNAEVTPTVAIVEITPEPTLDEVETSTNVVTKAVASPTNQQEVNKATGVQPTAATIKIQAPTPAISNTTNTTWVCNCSKTCPNMSCAEAQFQLNTCGCSRRDGDKDGIACNSQCQ